MNQASTSAELLILLGEQLRAQRLRMNLTVDEVAQSAGVSMNVVRRLETGDGSSLSSFVAVLKILGRADWLSTLKPAVTINPLDMLRQRGPRQRARKPRQPKTD